MSEPLNTEIASFFPNRDGSRLYGVLHRVAKDITCKRAIVYCAPLFEEKLWSHRIGVTFARYMAKSNIPVLRFDYFGDGESEGRFEDASVRTRVADILDAAAYCRQQTGAASIRLVGLCFGGTLALLAAQRDGISGVAAWSPVVDGERYIGEQLRIHLTSQMVTHRKIVDDRAALVRRILAGELINVEGYDIGKLLYEEMTEIRTSSLMSGLNCPIQVTQVSPSERTEPQYTELERMASSNLSFGRVREIKFWTQQRRVFPKCEALFARTAGWLTGP